MKLEEVILRGLASAIPAATAVPIGSLYFETDVGLTYRSTGAAWELYSATVSQAFDFGKHLAAPLFLPRA